MQFTHGSESEAEGDYNSAIYLPQRRIMMQDWADFHDKVCDSAKAGRRLKAHTGFRLLIAMPVRALRPTA